MPNIEIKAHCGDFQAARVIAEKHQTGYLGILHQIDTYFTTKNGRLKLREINGESAELIPYSKDYKSGPMKSNYAVLNVADVGLVKGLFSNLLGVAFVVDKSREVFLIENVRIHLDNVVGLGTFIEMEAVCASNSTEEIQSQTKKVHALIDLFEIKQKDLLDRSYVDYLSQKIESPSLFSIQTAHVL